MKGDGAPRRQRHGDDEEEDEEREEQPRPDAAKKQNDALRPRAPAWGRGGGASEGVGLRLAAGAMLVVAGGVLIGITR